MTQTMRERLIAASDAIVGWAPGQGFSEEIVDAILAEMSDAEANTLDAARYRYLRGDGRPGATQTAYEPEEAGVWGGKDLDDLCDAGIAAMIDAVREER